MMLDRDVVESGRVKAFLSTTKGLRIGGDLLGALVAICKIPFRVLMRFQRGGVLAGLALCALAGAGCSTGMISESGRDNTVIHERVALKNAANEITQTQWPMITAISFGERLTGVRSVGAHVTKRDAVTAYVAFLRQHPEPVAQLVVDAEAQLAAASQLVIAADIAATAIRPTLSDVALVEEAISDLRDSREILLSSLAMLKADTSLAGTAKRAVKRDYARAIREMGTAADILADRVALDRTQTVVQPRSLPGYFSGI